MNESKLLACVCLFAACTPATKTPPSIEKDAMSETVEAPEASVAREGVIVAYAKGNAIGKERYRDDGNELVSHIELGPNKLTVTLPHAKGKVIVERGGKREERTLGDGEIALENGSWQAFALVADRYPQAVEPQKVRVLLPSQNQVVDGTVSVKKDGSNRVVEVVIAGISVRAVVSPKGDVVSAEVPAQSVTALPEGQKPREPEARKVPDVAVAEAFEQKLSDAVIRGELWRPKKSEGAVPIVLVIAGSGPTDRDGNGGPGLSTDTYRLLAEGLAARGVASLRFDKRGVGRSSTDKKESELTMQTFADDVAAICKELRRDSRFSKLVLAGHSEGGELGLMVAQSVPLDGLALISTPGRSTRVILREQLASKVDAPTLKEVDRILTALSSNKPVGDVPPSLGPLFRPSVQPFLRSQMALDPPRLLGKAKATNVVVIQGQHDAQITEADARALKGARPKAELVLLPKANHVLKDEASASLPQRSYTDPTLPLSSGVIDALLRAVPH